MSDIRVDDDLWATSMMPEGVLERWLLPDGATVRAGDPVATIRIDDSLHDIIAPGAGRLTATVTSGQMVEPGSLIAQLDP